MVEKYKFFSSLRRLARPESDLFLVLRMEQNLLYGRSYYFNIDFKKIKEADREMKLPRDLLALPAA